ncbi:MAG TPA: GNAT family N-acetyltransferase [Spirochaetota bacterium]|jgi:GNAT superfamily N-acetyltransferase|nr:GNAT family N-acetyltransferase [Spirochaetota bacterium]HOH36901.1 GNAT family N-acetyltransferase [Spirochaetota bacterium]HPJ15239.1 GNAT family N-acetyltransferase [Spirochaetota bacterium]HPM34178.1 GNAT family N-acetyltransferase [Spirochaetota bacterium]HPY02944.1 GNAT family N-acetyltransferase [Spirochaetota bacterium]
MSISISTIKNADLDDIRNLQPEGWSDIIPAFKFYCASGFCYPFKLIADNKISGCGCAIVLERTAWLAHIIVSPEYRRNGLGSMIVSHLMNFLTDKNIQTVSLIATDDGLPVYQKFDFEKTENYLVLAKDTEALKEIPDCEVLPFIEKYRKEIYSLDQKASGENRIKVLQNMLSESFVCIKEGVLSGYFIPSLGEGLITAVDAESGISLLKHKNPLILSIPEANFAAIHYALSRGFTEQKSLCRMTFGNKLNRKPEYIYSRISGYLG